MKLTKKYKFVVSMITISLFTLGLVQNCVPSNNSKTSTSAAKAKIGSLNSSSSSVVNLLTPLTEPNIGVHWGGVLNNTPSVDRVVNIDPTASDVRSSNWYLSQWKKDAALMLNSSRSDYINANSTYRDPFLGNPEIEINSPSGKFGVETSLLIFRDQRNKNSAVFEIVGRNGWLNNVGGSNVFLSSDIQDKINNTMNNEINLTYEGKISKMNIKYNDNSEQTRNEVVVGQAFASFIAQYTPADNKPPTTLFVQILLGDSRGKNILFSGCYMHGSNLEIVYGHNLDNNFNAQASSGAITSKNFSLNKYLCSALAANFNCPATSVTPDFKSMSKDLANWRISSFYAGVETQVSKASAQAQTIPGPIMGSVEMGMQFSNLSITANKNIKYADCDSYFNNTPTSTCSDFTYSAYDACQPNGTQTRTVNSKAPINCTGGTPVTTQTCTYKAPVCEVGQFQSGSQTLEFSCGCGLVAGGILQANGCYHRVVTPTQQPICSSFNYSTYGDCQPNNTQSRSVISSSPASCTGGSPVISRACNYTAPLLTCSSFNYSGWEACQTNNSQTRSVTSRSPSNCTGGNPVTTQACIYTAPACEKGTFQSGNQIIEFSCGCGSVTGGVLQTNGCYHRIATAVSCSSFNYSAYGNCQPNNTRSRSVISGSPASCTGGNPVTSQSCNYVPPVVTCSSFNYSAYGDCQPNNTQSRSVTSSSPASCTGGNPVTSQSCNYVPPVVACSSFNYSVYSDCQSNNTQSRSVTSSSPASCTGGNPVTSQSCNYVPPVVVCSSFNYSVYSDCQPNNTRSRSVTSSSPASCTGGNPVTSQSCNYVAPVTCETGTFLNGGNTYEFSCGCGPVSGGVLQADGCYHRQQVSAKCETGQFQYAGQKIEYSCGCGAVAGANIQANGCYHRVVN